MQQQFCKFCGQPVVPNGRNLLQCPNGHENWLNPVPGAMAYVLDGDKVLFGVRSIEPNIGKLDPPGGYMNPGERAEETVAREVREEVGIAIKPLDIIGTYSTVSEGVKGVAIVFVAEYDGDKIAQGDDMSGGKPVWRSIDDMPTADELSFPWQIDAQHDLVAWYNAHRS